MSPAQTRAEEATPSKPDAESAIRVDHAGRRFRCDSEQFAEAILAELEQGQKLQEQNANLAEALRDAIRAINSGVGSSVATEKANAILEELEARK